ncbi:MAG: hypothetical protein IJ578_02725 [Bacteroidales bacterium]|nr:hypothetical protein [Bacteroidales bacterium]
MKDSALPEAYARLSDLLLQEKVHLDPALTFAGLCRRADAEPRAMDWLLRTELGLSGEGLLAALRSSDYADLARKYKALPKK